MFYPENEDIMLLRKLVFEPEDLKIPVQVPLQWHPSTLRMEATGSSITLLYPPIRSYNFNTQTRLITNGVLCASDWAVRGVAKHAVHSNQLDVFSPFLAPDETWLRTGIFTKERNQKHYRIPKYDAVWPGRFNSTEESMRWVGHVARTEQKRTVYFDWKTWNRSLEEHKCRWVDNITRQSMFV